MMYTQQMGAWGWLMMLAFWVAIVVLIVWAVRTATTPPRHKSDITPQRILDERLARGEIERDEYEERRQLLAQHK